MTQKSLRNVDRRRIIQIVGAGGLAGLAGCTGFFDDDPDPGDLAADDGDLDPADDDDDNDMVDPVDDDADDTDHDDPDDEDPVELSTLQQLVEVFDDQPFNEAQMEAGGHTPHHVWKFVSDETFIGLHVNEPNPEDADELLYITIGTKGYFNQESQPDEEFTHFHLVEADDWESGHGGENADDEGYWLTHIAATELQMPFHGEPIGPGVDYEFMPTPAPEDGPGGTADFTAPGADEGSLSAADRDALIEIFDAEPFNEAQMEANGHTPSHVWWSPNDEVTVFLHLNEPNLEEADELLYFGLGVDGNFTYEDIPMGQADDFTHFHLYEADDWESGHGGDTVDDEGMWLVHHAVQEVQMPFHGEPIDVGIDREFMPTPAPDTPSGLNRLVDVFDDQPFNEAQMEAGGHTPHHVWKFVSDETFIGLHVNEPNPEEADELLYITIGTKGYFNQESQPDEEFTHFHLVEADSWDAGHGGDNSDDEGYWLTHIAATELEMPFHGEPIGPGVDYEFMPTPAPEDGPGGRSDFTSPGEDEGSLSPADRDALIELFDDQPFNADQLEANGYTPSHVWWSANDDVTVFLHLNEPNPEEADELLYFGLGVDANFTHDDIPMGQGDDFTHFHLYDADSWDAGHGGNSVDDAGMWLVHHAVQEVQMPFHGEPIDVGIDREFMPTPAPDA